MKYLLTSLILLAIYSFQSPDKIDHTEVSANNLPVKQPTSIVKKKDLPFVTIEKSSLINWQLDKSEEENMKDILKTLRKRGGG
ncbi:hypothetical protein [Sphingobacterium sp.]|uniref:hypothetical protein n=1 Tax=Sphingobacterium sp. TaxID=341027 RepID=UPI00289D0A55|nr:hypothetical protein [Sphingobacterium sp.]